MVYTEKFDVRYVYSQEFLLVSLYPRYKKVMNKNKRNVHKAEKPNELSWIKIKLNRGEQ